MDHSARRVWLLGSGFSKPLDGPLLRDLFRSQSSDETTAFFPVGDYPHLSETIPWVHECYHAGRERGLWPHAEKFLSYVDDAYHAPGQLQTFLRGFINTCGATRRPHIMSSDSPAEQKRKREHLALYGPDNFNLKAKRVLAAECERFVMTADYQSEAWLPFREWVKSRSLR